LALARLKLTMNLNEPKAIPENDEMEKGDLPALPGE
jgi:hypothetical protein